MNEELNFYVMSEALSHLDDGKANAELFSHANNNNVTYYMPTWEGTLKHYQETAQKEGLSFGDQEEKALRGIYNKKLEQYRQYTNGEFNSYDVDLLVPGTFKDLANPWSNHTPLSADYSQVRIAELGLGAEKLPFTYKTPDFLSMSNAAISEKPLEEFGYVTVRDAKQSAKDEFESNGIYYTVDSKGALIVDGNGKPIPNFTVTPEDDLNWYDTEVQWSVEADPTTGKPIVVKILSNELESNGVFKVNTMSPDSDADMESSLWGIPVEIARFAPNFFGNVFKVVGFTGDKIQSFLLDPLEKEKVRKEDKLFSVWITPFSSPILDIDFQKLYTLGNNMITTSNIDQRQGFIDGGAASKVKAVSDVMNSYARMIAVSAATSGTGGMIFGGLESGLSAYETAVKSGFNETESLIASGVATGATIAIMNLTGQGKFLSKYMLGSASKVSNSQFGKMFREAGAEVVERSAKYLNTEAGKKAVEVLGKEQALKSTASKFAVPVFTDLYNKISKSGIGKAYNSVKEMAEKNWMVNAAKEANTEGLEELGELLVDNSVKKYYRENVFFNTDDSFFNSWKQDTSKTPREKRFIMGMFSKTNAFAERTWEELKEEALETYVTGSIGSALPSSMRAYNQRKSFRQTSSDYKIIHAVLQGKKKELDKHYEDEIELIKRGKSSLGNNRFGIDGKLVDTTKDNWWEATEAFHVLNSVKKKVDYTDALIKNLTITDEVKKDFYSIAEELQKYVSVSDIEAQFVANYLHVFGLSEQLREKMKKDGFITDLGAVETGKFKVNDILKADLDTLILELQKDKDKALFDFSTDKLDLKSLNTFDSMLRGDEVLGKMYVIQLMALRLKEKLYNLEASSKPIDMSAKEAIRASIKILESNYTTLVTKFNTDIAENKIDVSKYKKLKEYMEDYIDIQEATVKVKNRNVEDMVYESYLDTLIKEQVTLVEEQLKEEGINPEQKIALEYRLKVLKEQSRLNETGLNSRALAEDLRALKAKAESLYETHSKGFNNIPFMKSIILGAIQMDFTDTAVYFKANFNGDFVNVILREDNTISIVEGEELLNSMGLTAKEFVGLGAFSNTLAIDDVDSVDGKFITDNPNTNFAEGSYYISKASLFLSDEDVLENNMRQLAESVMEVTTDGKGLVIFKAKNKKFKDLAEDLNKAQTFQQMTSKPEEVQSSLFQDPFKRLLEGIESKLLTKKTYGQILDELLHPNNEEEYVNKLREAYSEYENSGDNSLFFSLIKSDAARANYNQLVLKKSHLDIYNKLTNFSYESRYTLPGLKTISKDGKMTDLKDRKVKVIDDLMAEIEKYISLSSGMTSSIYDRDNKISNTYMKVTMKSLTKEFTEAGLDVGYENDDVLNDYLTSINTPKEVFKAYIEFIKKVKEQFIREEDGSLDLDKFKTVFSKLMLKRFHDDYTGGALTRSFTYNHNDIKLYLNGFLSLMVSDFDIDTVISKLRDEYKDMEGFTPNLEQRLVMLESLMSLGISKEAEKAVNDSIKEALITYSTEFDGTSTLKELKDHVVNNNADIYSLRTVFIPGYAGSGKTFILPKIMKIYTALTGKNVAVSAPGPVQFNKVLSVSPENTKGAVIDADFHTKTDILSDVDLVIIDEITLLNNEDFKANMNALSPTHKILLLGDDTQLKAFKKDGSGRERNTLATELYWPELLVTHNYKFTATTKQIEQRMRTSLVTHEEMDSTFESRTVDIKTSEDMVFPVLQFKPASSHKDNMGARYLDSLDEFANEINATLKAYKDDNEEIGDPKKRKIAIVFNKSISKEKFKQITDKLSLEPKDINGDSKILFSTDEIQGGEAEHVFYIPYLMPNSRGSENLNFYKDVRTGTSRRTKSVTMFVNEDITGIPSTEIDMAKAQSTTLKPGEDLVEYKGMDLTITANKERVTKRNQELTEVFDLNGVATVASTGTTSTTTATSTTTEADPDAEADTDESNTDTEGMPNIDLAPMRSEFDSFNSLDQIKAKIQEGLTKLSDCI